MDGILIINKPLGMTSHDVVARVRKLLRQKRVGHTGTLDPLASGVLPLCLGQGTRVAEYLSESGKAYEAEITFGKVTDTYDTEGTVIRSADASMLTRAGIEEALPAFLGRQMQRPPLYSAIKLQGQPAYKLARAGEEVMLEARPVEIQKLDILAWQPPRLKLAVACSKGTYIRSLAYDLGERLGCGAHLSGLIRTRSGPFGLDESVTLEEFAATVEEGKVEHYLLPADRALQHYPALHLDEETARRVLHGNSFFYQLSGGNGQMMADISLEREALAPRGAFLNTYGYDLARVYDSAGHFLAIASWDARQHLWQPKKVLVER